MGYFNFYFLKKLLSNKKVRKILFMIALFILIIIIKNSVFAVTFDYDNITYTFPDLPDNMSSYSHYVCFFNITNRNEMTYYASNYPFEVSNVSNSSYTFRANDGTNHSASGKYRTYTKSTDKWGSTYNFTSAFSYSAPLTRYPVVSTETLSYVDGNGQTVVLCQGLDSYSEYPHFLNDNETIATGGQSLVIMPGDFPDTKEIRFCIQSITEENNIISYHNLFTPISLTNQSQYYVGESSGFYYSIPWSFILSYINLGNNYNYVLAYEINNTTEKYEVEVLYGGATTPEDAIYNSQVEQNNAINEQTDAINNQTQVINQQTEAINDLNDTMTDDTISSGASDLPSIDITDPSQAPLDNIFMIIYNAFCTGNAQDIVFPIPFTNKNITLSPYYVRDMLNNNGGSWIVSFADLFWQFVIAFFIIKDVSKKVNKIKSGDIENIENTNIKEDML